jgi:DNA-binding transcriptional LysR family regulator
MELRHLRYFVAVGENLSFRRAAEQINISRPALSMQIKDLEAELGVTLLRRSTASVNLTDAGWQFLEDAREILERVDEASNRAREAASGRSGRVMVAGGGPLIPTFLPAALRAYRQRFPNIEVVLREGEAHENLAALLARELDVIFLIQNTLPKDPRLAHQPVLTSSVNLVLGAQHRLAEKASVSIAELVKEPFLAVGRSRSSPHVNYLRDLFRVRGYRLPPPRTVPSFDTLMAMVQGEQGISFVPSMVHRLRYQDVRFVPLLEVAADLHFELHAVWLREESSAAVRHFLRQLELVTHTDKAEAEGQS